MIQKNTTFIAQKYLFAKTKNSTIRFMILLCFIGILIASASLALVVSIMTGFEQATHQKIQSIYPDLIIDGQGNQFDMHILLNILKNPKYKIQHVAEHQTTQALLHNSNNNQSPQMIIITAIDPQTEQQITHLEKKLLNNQFSLTSLLTKNQILIGVKLAEILNLSINSNAHILYSNDGLQGLKLTFQQAPIIISGIFKTGIEEFDTNTIYCNKSLFQKLFPDIGIEFVHLKLQPNADAQKIALDLKQDIHADVYAWQTLYPTLISALKLEKWGMFFILLLIVFVASMNIISLIFMFIAQKKRDIAIFMFLGMPTKSIRTIFITISLTIATIATALGLFIAFMIGIFLQTFPFIKLPDNIYDSTYLPIKMESFVFFTIFVITIVIAFLASVVATRNIEQIHIIETLKNE